jgi:hypothetical protein
MFRASMNSEGSVPQPHQGAPCVGRSADALELNQSADQMWAD